MVTLVSADS